MRKFLIGAAAIALAAGGAMADPGKNESGKGGREAAGQERGDKGPKWEDRGRRGGEGGKRFEEVAKRQEERGREAAKRQDERIREDIKRRDERIREASKRQDERIREAGKRQDERIREAGKRRDESFRKAREWEDDFRGDRREARIVRFIEGDDRRALIEGCPPGLAKKNTGCLPPGLAKQRHNVFRSAYYEPSWFGYDRLDDGRYFYDDGYLYRLGSNDSVLGFVPLLGGALSIGNPWPSYYDPYPVPEYYQDYYNLGTPDSYRYADDVLYRVDPQTGVIDSIAALLTGDTFAVGQPMPAGYDVYNVPYGYQDRYYDTDDAYYRYADGYVYEVDPTTQLVQAVIELLV